MNRRQAIMGGLGAAAAGPSVLKSATSAEGQVMMKQGLVGAGQLADQCGSDPSWAAREFVMTAAQRRRSFSLANLPETMRISVASKRSWSPAFKAHRNAELAEIDAAESEVNMPREAVMALAKKLGWEG